MATANRNVQAGYPLSALFVLLAACAVVSALLTPVVHAAVARELTVAQLVAATVLGMILTGLVGSVIGLYHYRPLRGAGWGALTGAVIGALIGPLTLAPPEAIGQLVTMSIGGSIVMLITGAMFAFSARD